MNCRTKGILFKGYTPIRNGDAITQCLPNLKPVFDSRGDNAIKGVDVNGVDVSELYVTDSKLEILWRRWKRERGF